MKKSFLFPISMNIRHVHFESFGHVFDTQIERSQDELVWHGRYPQIAKDHHFNRWHGDFWYVFSPNFRHAPWHDLEEVKHIPLNLQYPMKRLVFVKFTIPPINIDPAELEDKFPQERDDMIWHYFQVEALIMEMVHPNPYALSMDLLTNICHKKSPKCR